MADSLFHMGFAGSDSAVDPSISYTLAFRLLDPPLNTRTRIGQAGHFQSRTSGISSPWLTM